MDSRLFQAAERGDTSELHALLEEDHLVLQKVALLPYADTPLHIATLAGRKDFVKEIVQLVPSFAWEHNKDGFAPLHIASATGNVGIVREILKVSPDLCLVKDKGGRTALHYAAIKGKIDVVEELLSHSPEAVREVTANGETALHLAVVNSQFDAFRVLIEKLCTNDFELIHATDDYGNTVLQLAESTKQLQVLNLLRDHGIISMDHIMDELQGQTQELNNGGISISIQNHVQGKEIRRNRVTLPPPSTEQDHQSSIIEQETKNLRRVVVSKGVVPVLAGILATSAYREALTPPPTIWKPDMKLDGSCFLNMFRHFSLTQSRDQCPPATYYLFMSFNSAAFYCALSLIFLHQVPGFLQALLPGSLVSSLLSYMVFLLSMFPDATTFLIINSVAFLVFAYICLVKAVGKRVIKWMYTVIKEKSSVKYDESLQSILRI